MSDYAKQPRRKFCQFCKDEANYVDYKDTQMLRKYVTDRGKINVQHQRDIANAVASKDYAVPSVLQRGHAPGTSTQRHEGQSLSSASTTSPSAKRTDYRSP